MPSVRRTTRAVRASRTRGTRVGHLILRRPPIRTIAERVIRQAPVSDGVSDYRIAVLLAHPRSGSNLLGLTLDGHPNVSFGKEPFNVRVAVLDDSLKYPRLATMLRDADPARFLEAILLRERAMNLHVVGFKLMTQHLTHAPFRDTLRELLIDRDVAFISLRRRDKLATFVSFQRALQTNQWIARSGDGQQRPITLDPEECETFFRRSRESDELHDEILSEREPTSNLSLTYEDMVDDFDQTIAGVQDFLKVESTPLAPRLVRQRQLPVATSIANYAELATHFSGTEWERFFRQDDFDRTAT